MEQATFIIDDRRGRDRHPVKLNVRCDEAPGMTLNVSLRGARLWSRRHLPRRFLLRLRHQGQELQLAAERVWQESLGGGGQIAGVRFTPGLEQQARMLEWFHAEAC